MNTLDAIMTRRTVRKFAQQEISENKLKTLVDAARLAAYGSNIQALRYAIVTDPAVREQVFATTKWAACIPDGTPKEGERPTAYILVFTDQTVKKEAMVDAGAAVTNMMLAAHEMGLGSCWIGSLNRVQLREILQVPQELTILYALALGYPAQQSQAVEYKDSFNYYLDDEQILNVPKLPLEKVLWKQF